MAVGRISGPLLKRNLLREGIDLAFETDLLYLDVIHGRVGIKTTSPSHELEINGTTRTTNLEVTTQADIASFTINGNTIASSNGVINIEPSGTNPVLYQAKLLVNNNLQITTNAISTTDLDSDLEFNTTGTGQVNVNSNMYVTGNIHATGNITADGDIVIGDDNTDSITFNADIASNIVPDETNTYDLGANSLYAGTIYSYNFDGTNGIRLPVSTNLSFGTTGDFTIEFWMKAGASQTPYATITDSSTNNQATEIGVGINNGGIAGKISFQAAGGSGTINGATTVLDDNWHHIACVKHGSNGYIFVDGVLDASTSSWGTINEAYLSGGSIGRSAYGTGTNSDNTFTGYLSNFRVIKGLALYTVNFTPPLVVLTATTETQLLTLKSGTIADESLNAFSLTAQATFPTVSTSVAPNIGDPAGGIKEWRTLYAHNVITTNITSETAVVNGIDLVLPQGNTIYVAKNGNDANAGVHESNPLLTLKAALAQAVSGDAVIIYAGVYEEEFPLTVPQGVTVRGAGIRAVNIKPTTATRYNDAFLLNGETTVEDLAVSDFFSGGNFFEILNASAGTATVNVGTAPFAHTYVAGGTVTFTGNLTYPTAPSTIYTTTASSIGSLTINVGTVGFSHTYVSGGTVTFNENTYNVTTAVYTHTTGVLVISHEGPDAGTSTSVTLENLVFSCVDAVANITGATYTYTTGSLVITHDGGNIASVGATAFLSNLTFSCAGPVGTSTRVFPDNGYAFRFADDITISSRSPYVRNVTVLTKGSVTSESDPLGFDQGDAGKGAYIDGAYANAASKEAAMLFHSVTFITPNVDTITAKNGVRVEWLNSFTYFANKGINAISSAYGFAQQGKTRLRIDNRVGTWAVGNTLSYYDSNGTTLLASGVISSIDGDYVNLTGNCTGFETITDRVGKTVYAQGDAKLSTAQKKFGTASLALDGASDYASIASNPDFSYGTDDFTIELWWYSNDIASAQQYLLDQRTSASEASILLYCGVTGIIRLYVNGANQLVANTTVTPNTWNHIAISRESGVTRMFINGILQTATYTDGNDYQAKPLYIGASYLGTLSTNGYIDEVRITKGNARYTTGFVVPTSPFSGDLNTVLLLHFNGINGSITFLDDGITFQDLRTSAGGTASLINFADYSDFGAEIRSIGSANVYGNYGTYGDGQGVVIYLISQNYAYVGAGKKSTNDPNDRIAANEVVELNLAKIYYTSVDNEGNFSVGDSFYVNQKTGEVLFGGESLSITAASGVTFTDGTNTTIITSTNIDTGNLRISGNTIESLTGDVNITSASGAINLQNNTYVTGNLDVTGDVTIGGNIQIGNESTDTVSFVAGINSDLIPADTETYDLGTPDLRWNVAYLSRAEVDGLVIDSNTISTTLGNDDLQLIANGTGRIYIPSNDVQIDQNLTVTNNLTVTTGTTYTKNIEVTGTITHVGDYNQTGNFTTSGTLDVTGNITGTGYLDLPLIHIENNVISTKVAGTDLDLRATGTGNIVFEDFRFTDNNIQSISANTDITLVPQGTGSVIVNSTQSLQIPVGTTLERPDVPANGMIRYNTDLARYEGYNNGYWLQLSGVIDNSGNTRIIAEATPGANDNVIYFYANNNLTATLDSTKLFTQRLQTSNLDINSNTITPLNPNSDINLTATGTGGVRIGNFKIRNNSITNIVPGSITEFAESGDGYVKFAGVNGIVLPSGDTLTQRPLNPVTGMTRFNTAEQLVEVYNGVSWSSVAGASGGVTSVEATELGISAALIFG